MAANMLFTEYISWIIKHLESVQLFCRIYTVPIYASEIHSMKEIYDSNDY